MRLIKPDAEGYIICPQCKRRYKPVLPIPDDSDMRAIQDIYPDSEAWEREQQLLGICSDRCYDEFLGGPQPSSRYDENGRRKKQY